MKLSLAWRKHGARTLLGIMLTLAAAVLCLAGNDTIARLDAMLGGRGGGGDGLPRDLHGAGRGADAL